MTTTTPPIGAVDIVALHESKIEELEHILHVEVPHAREQVAKLKLVLKNKDHLTDALANAVFKNHDIVRNANLKKRSVKRREKGDEKGAEEHSVDDEAYQRIQDDAQEHKNYLRRLKGKTAAKLTKDEVYMIKSFIEQRERWIARHENGYDLIDYVFKAQPLLDEYTKECERVQSYLHNANDEHDKLAIDEARKRQRITSSTYTSVDSTSNNIVATITPPPPPPVSHIQPSTAITALATIPVDLSKRRSGTVPSINSYLAQTDAFSRTRELQSEYLQLIGEEDVTGLRWEQLAAADHNSLYCDTCHVERIIDHSEACIVCPSCAKSERYNENSLRTVPFADPVSAPRSKGTYEKKTYYERWKKMVTGQLNNEIPDEDWQQIYLECVNRRYNFITRAMLRKLLRTLGMTRHYELVPMITNELNGVPLIQWSRDEEKTLDAMFDEAVDLFDRCPVEIKRRSNFISYAYFFYQACTMAGYLEYRESFPLLTGIDNKKRHDRIWQWMCENKTGEPKWVFYPTI